ncbi:MAG TPA: FUSC family protein [Candidatus Dormibacteraeota bacterium]|nr:FUSC family protein [Candidatus Dormibacteraeota bacterium]
MSTRSPVTASTETPQAPARRPQVSLSIARDPGFAALRRASRAAIVITVAFAFGELVLHEAQNIIFIVFGCFAMLVMSDFGGLRPQRARAYLTATVVGAVLVAAGTLVSPIPWLAATVMFVVALPIAFTRVFGGYFSAAQNGLLLSFVIAVSLPAPVSSIPTRVAGWTLAGIVSTLAGLFLWPRFEGVTLYKHAARACTAAARLVEAFRAKTSDDELEPLIDSARKAEQATQQEYVASARRPAAPRRRDRAFVELLTELQRIIDIIERPFQQLRRVERPCIAEGDQLAAAVVAALRASGDVLTGGPPPDLRAVEDARLRHREALDRWAARALRSGQPAEAVLDGLGVDHTLRVIGYITISLGTNAIIAVDRRPDATVELPASVPRREGTSGALTRALHTIRTHLQPSSTVLQGSLRVALGLALAVFLARALELSHAFWVVLGTLQVLRSTALGTGRSTVQAILGNGVGVIIGGAFAVLAGNHPVVMWAALPLVVFGAAYAATAVGFLASQAAFTINLVLLFNLISPAGWQIGLVRIEDLVVGAAISIVVGLLLLPRGARREFAKAIGRFYRAMVGYVDQGLMVVLGFEAPGRVDPARRTAIEARDRAGEAFDAFVSEHATTALDPRGAGFLLSGGNQGILAGDLLHVIASVMGYQGTACADGASEVKAQSRILLAGFLHEANRLSLVRSDDAHEQISVDALRRAALTCLRRWRNNDEVGRGALAVVMASEWVQNLGRLEADLERPVGAAVEAARTPWWR